MKRQIRTYAQATEPAGTELVAQIGAQADRLLARLAKIRSTIVVASGKGGVGKSFVAAQLARALTDRGLFVGALDADVNGPSLARMLGVSPARLHLDERGVYPAHTRAGCALMSTELLLESADSPLRWREPDVGGFVWQSALETGMLREFLSDVHWGDLDALVIDLPPGTDKIARILPLLPRITAMIIVTTPSNVANAAVARSLRQVREAGVSNVGIVCNMDGYVCAHCGAVSPLFADTPGDEDRREIAYRDDIAAKSENAPERGIAAVPATVSTWASIPFDPRAAAATDAGCSLPAGSPVVAAIDQLVTRLQSVLNPVLE